jgi:hypothetical protein
LSPIHCVTLNLTRELRLPHVISLPLLLDVSTPPWCLYSTAFPVLYSTAARWIRDERSAAASRNVDGSGAMASGSGRQLHGGFWIAATWRRDKSVPIHVRNMFSSMFRFLCNDVLPSFQSVFPYVPIPCFGMKFPERGT